LETRLDLGTGRGDTGKKFEDLLVGHVLPGRNLRLRRAVRRPEDVVAKIDTYVADVDAWSRDELAHLGFRLAAE
jgi:hypothetical protein